MAEKDDEPNMVDHPVFFCPFCGKGADAEEVDAKTGGTPTELPAWRTAL